MRSRVRRHLTFANVCSLLALLIALGTGSAYAANTIGSGDIIDGQVQTVDLQDGGVTTQKLAPAAVTAGQLADNAVSSPQVADASLTSADIAPGSIAGSSVGTHTITQRNISGTDTAGKLSVGRLAKGRCTTVSVGDGGAKPGDAGMLTTNGRIPKGEVLYLQRVLSNGAQIKACNLAGKRLPALSRLPVRILTFH